MKDLGVPASPSGHSAKPEPVVSTLRASVLNAALDEIEIKQMPIDVTPWPVGLKSLADMRSPIKWMTRKEFEELYPNASPLAAAQPK